MAVTENYVFNLPFAEQIKYFRGKVNLPTKAWTDMWQGMHSRAFVVAGATKAELLCDLRSAVDKAISKGTTLQEFRRDFGQIVEKFGWDYKGGHDWRTRVIYETNLNTANAAGRYKQMTDPDVLKYRPYWRYRHGGSAQPREEHLRWDGLILPADDPWWETHYPPNGWGCSCYVESLSDDDLERLGLAVMEAPEDTYYDWTNPKTGETVKVPDGISPGWAYNVGDTAWGRQVAGYDSKAWELMPQGMQTTSSSPLMPVKSDIKPDYNIPDTSPGIRSYLMQQFEGQQTKVFSFNHNDLRLDLAVDAKYLSNHLIGTGKTNRAAFLPYLQDTITNPQEVWLAFEKHVQSGKVQLRQHFIKYYDAIGSGKGVLIAFDAANGQMINVTFAAMRTGYIDSRRVGFLAYKK